MTDKIEDSTDNISRELNNICDECKVDDESVSQNLILTGYKICKSCRISKTIFPFQLIWLVGNIFILLITNEIDKNAIIKKDKNTIPKDLKFDFKFKTCFVEIIRPAKIQNCVRNIIGIINSGVTAKNLNNPGACAYPTAVNTFLKGTFVCLSGKSFTPIT